MQATDLIVTGRNGLRAVIEPTPESERADRRVLLRLPDGRRLSVPEELLRPEGAGYHVDLGPEDIPEEVTRRTPPPVSSIDTAAPPPLPPVHSARQIVPEASPEPAAGSLHTGQERVIPVLAEELHVSKRQVETGAGVTVNKRVHTHEELIDLPVMRDIVDVRRVQIGQPVNGPLPVRQEGDVTIVPVVEEVLRVEKVLVLKEEIHITRQRVEERATERVQVAREEVEIIRTDENGRAIPLREPLAAAPTPLRRPDPEPDRSTSGDFFRDRRFLK